MTFTRAPLQLPAALAARAASFAAFECSKKLVPVSLVLYPAVAFTANTAFRKTNFFVTCRTCLNLLLLPKGAGLLLSLLRLLLVLDALC